MLLNYLSRLDFRVVLSRGSFASGERSLVVLVIIDPRSPARSLFFTEQDITWQTADVSFLQVHVSPLEIFVLVLPKLSFVVRKRGVNTLAFKLLEELVV